MYNFVLDKNGNVVGHTDPEFAQFQSGGVTIFPDSQYRPDQDDLWAIKDGNKMVHRSTGLTPEEEHQKGIATVAGQVMQVNQTVQTVGKQLASLTAEFMNGGSK